MESSKTKNVYSPEFRCSFINTDKPRLNKKNGKEEYSLVALYPKELTQSTDAAWLKQKQILLDAFNEAVREKWGSNPPKNIRKPFRNQGDRAKENEQGKMILPDGYVDGAIYINFKSNRKPGVLNQNAKPILEPTEFYSGCYAICTFNAVAYDLPENKGVSFYLVNVQKTREGEPFGNLAKAEDQFKPIAGAEVVEQSPGSVNDLI